MKMGDESGSLVSWVKVTSAGGKTRNGKSWHQQARWGGIKALCVVSLYTSYMQEAAKDGEAVGVAGAGWQGLLQGVLWGYECTTPCSHFLSNRSGMGMEPLVGN